MSLISAYIVPHPPLIIPEIGKGEETKIQKTIDAYKKIAKKIADYKPETIILTTPHSVLYTDYIHISPGSHANGNFSSFGSPEVHITVNYDEELIKKISTIAQTKKIPAGTLGEMNNSLDHATMIPLYFLNQYYQNYKIIRISLSGLSPLMHYRFGKCINEAIESINKRAIFIASGDLSHKLKVEGPYGFAKEGPIFDQQITEAMADGDFLRFLAFEEDFSEAAAECGLRSFIIMAGALDGKAIKSNLLSYEGPFGVGYAIADFEITGKDENRFIDLIFSKNESMNVKKIKNEEDPFVQLARKSLEYFIKTSKRLPLPAKLPTEMTQEQAGVFVSLKMEGRLRGCIGTISPTTKSIADEIIQNAISAGIDDPRFTPVEKDELDRLIYSVDVLKKPEPISSMAELDTKRYGVIVSADGRRGLLLPNLEGIDTPVKQVSIALQKGGIDSNETYIMERFEVVRHE